MKATIHTPINMSTGKPEPITANNADYYRAGDTVEIVEKLVGENYNSNNTWYKLDNGGIVWSGGITASDLLDTISFTTGSSAFKKWKIDSFWKTTNGQGITVGLIDTFLDTAHGSLRYSNISSLTQGTPVISSHSTYMAAIIAGTDSMRGYTGIAPGANLVHCGFDKMENLAAGALYEKIKLLEGADIISMSFNTDTSDYKPRTNDAKKLIALIETYTRENNTVFVAACGNEGIHTGFRYYPAAYDNIISVSGWDANDETLVNDDANAWDGISVVTSFESYFDQCVNACEDFSMRDLNSFKGTSPACAFTAAIFALVKSKFLLAENRKLGHAEITELCFAPVSVRSTKAGAVFQTHTLSIDKISSLF